MSGESEMTTAANKMLYPLRSLPRYKRARFGSKAVSLNRLLAQGLLVPAGFALSSQACHRFLRFNHIRVTTDEALFNTEGVIESILAGCVPPEVADELFECFQVLSHAPHGFVVRSSSLIEDQEEVSMAGAFSSFLRLRTLADLMRSIKECYASLFNPRVLEMIAEARIDLDALSMGVVLQEYVTGSPSGVIHSADTVEMKPDVVVIAGVKGGCRGFVSGQAQSALYKVDKSSGMTLERYSSKGAPRLRRELLDRLRHLTIRIEEQFGLPQDVEWTCAKGQVCVLQARPITTYKSLEFPMKWRRASDPDRTWRLMYPSPLPPLLQDIAVRMGRPLNRGLYVSGGPSGRLTRILNGYAYMSSRPYKARQRRLAKFRRRLSALAAEGKNIFHDVVLPELQGLRRNIESLLRDRRQLRRLALLDACLAHFDMAWELHPVAIAGGDYVRTFGQYLRSLGLQYNEEDVFSLAYRKSTLCEERMLLLQIAKTVKADEGIMELFRQYAHDGLLYRHLRKSVNNRRFWRLVARYLARFGLFIFAEGHGMAGLDQYSFKEREWQLCDRIRGLLDLDRWQDGRMAEDLLKRKRALKQQAIRRLRGDRRREFSRNLRMAEMSFVTGDDHHYNIDMMASGYLRHAVLVSGRSLAHQGRLDDAYDVFFLHLPELRGILAKSTGHRISRRTIARRRSAYRAQLKLLPPDCVGRVAATSPASSSPNGCQDPSNEEQMAVTGIPGIRKVVRGKARFLRSVDDHRNVVGKRIFILENGHIDITPLLSRALGIVILDGSPYDHVGIVAREMAIPSLYQLHDRQDAIRNLEDDQWVTLDGLKGELRFRRVPGRA